MELSTEHTCCFHHQISDAIRYNAKDATQNWSFHSLKYSLLLCPIVGVLGGVFFFMASRYIAEDRQAAQQLTEGTVL